MTAGTRPPKFSVSIPTLNSGRTLGRLLDSIRRQSTRDVEVLVVDGGSVDNTLALAREGADRVLSCTRPLLAARVAGIEASRGELLVLVDSDQVLAEDTLERAAAAMADHDMACLGEDTLHPDRRLARMIQASRDHVQSNLEAYLNPWSGLLMPRVYRSTLLRDAITRIPPTSLDFVTDRDHQILFYECYRQSKSIAFLPHAVWHDDLTSAVEVVRKAGHWGWGAGTLRARGLYPELLTARYQIRRAGRGARSSSPPSLRAFLAANAIATLKGVPYEFWFRLGSFRSARPRPEQG